MTPIYTPNPPRVPSTKSPKANVHGRFRVQTENVLGILQEVEKRLHEEMAAVEDISWRLQPIIRSPPTRSKFTWSSGDNPALKTAVDQSKPNQDDLECGDSFHVGNSTCTSSETETKSFDSPGDNCQKSCTELIAPGSTATCSEYSNDIRSSLGPQNQEPSESREPVRSEHALFQGHRDSFNSRGLPSDQPFVRTRNAAWIIDAMHLLKEYYLKRAHLSLQVEPALQNVIPLSVSNPVVAVSSTNKATQTPPVICEAIHTSLCGHFQWTASDRISPDIAFYISPFDSEDGIEVYRTKC